MLLKSNIFSVLLLIVFSAGLSGTIFLVSQNNTGLFFLLNLASVSGLSFIFTEKVKDYVLFEISEMENV